jgi:hypothetical protein
MRWLLLALQMVLGACAMSPGPRDWPNLPASVPENNAPVWYEHPISAGLSAVPADRCVAPVREALARAT